MDLKDVKATRVGTDGTYELSLGKAKHIKTVRAVRQPDLYFVITLDGVAHKGYLKDLKAKFLAYAQGEPVEAPARPVRSAVSNEPDEPWVEIQQRRIDEADTREEQINRWVAAYNIETVAVHCGAKRHTFRLPKGKPPEPPLEKCFDPKREQYVWPNLYQEG